MPKQNQQKLPQEPKDNAANLNGDRIKLARPVQRPDQTKDLPKVDGSKDRLVDLNLGEPKDDGNVLDLPGLAAVGLPSSSDSKKTDSKSDPIVDLHLGDKKGDKSDKVAEIPNVVRISAPHHDQHDKVHPSNGKQEHHSTHDPLEGATIRVGKMACIEVSFVTLPKCALLICTLDRRKATLRQRWTSHWPFSPAAARRSSR